jgi:hypothetical protein
MTNQEHNKYLGIGFLVHGGLQLLLTLAMSMFFIVILSSIPDTPGHEAPPLAFFFAIFAFVFIFQLLFTAPALVAGYALLKRKSWARMAGIIGAVTAALSFPIGTAVCVYALWFLLGENWKELYAPQARGPRPGELPYPGEYVPWEEQARRAARDKAPPPPPPDWR